MKFEKSPGSPTITSYKGERGIEKSKEKKKHFRTTILSKGQSDATIKRLKDRNAQLTTDCMIGVMQELVAQSTTTTSVPPDATAQAIAGNEAIRKKIIGLTDFFFTHIFLVVHLPGHWVLCRWNTKDNLLEYYDSMLSMHPRVPAEVATLADILEAKIVTALDMPQQQDSVSCGVFALAFAERLICNHRLCDNVDVADCRHRFTEMVKKRI